MNRRRMTTTVLVMVMATAAAGCDKGTGLEPGQSVQRSSSALQIDIPPLVYFQPLPRFTLAVDLIGRGLNGTALNGKVLDGRFVVEVSLKDAVPPKGGRKDQKLSATSFGNGSLDLKKARKDTVGMTFQGVLDDGDPLPLRIDDVQSSTDPDSPYLRYAVSYPSDGRWVPLCGSDDAGGAILAIPLEGVWDYRQGVRGGGSWSGDEHAFTFACEGFVLAKCVAMGYPPWVEGRMCTGSGSKKKCVKITLAAHHQACARMLRADFCGDGTPYTVDGTWVNAYDGIGIRNDSEDWPMEAEWDDDGARCAVHDRLYASGIVPTCMASLSSPGCGAATHFEQGTLIMSESQTVGLP